MKTAGIEVSCQTLTLVINQNYQPEWSARRTPHPREYARQVSRAYPSLA